MHADDEHVLIRLEREQSVIAGDEQLRVARDGSSEHEVVLRMGSDTPNLGREGRESPLCGAACPENPGDRRPSA